MFQISWYCVFPLVGMAVEWGCAHQELSGIQTLGIDEISRRCGDCYQTLVYQIDTHYDRLLEVG